MPAISSKGENPIIRSIVPVLHKVRMKDANERIHDLEYWLAQPVNKRAEAVTFLICQMLEEGQRMDKTIVNKIRPEK